MESSLQKLQLELSEIEKEGENDDSLFEPEEKSLSEFSVSCSSPQANIATPKNVLGKVGTAEETKMPMVKQREPEPIPIFSCIYCVNEFLVFSHLSRKLLEKKYGPQASTKDITFGTSNALQRQSEVGEEKPSSRFYLDVHEHYYKEPGECYANNQQGTRPFHEAEHKLKTITSTTGKTQFLPKIADQNKNLQWVLQKFHIYKRSKARISAFVDKSVSSNPNPRSGRKTYQSIKKSGGLESPRAQLTEIPAKSLFLQSPEDILSPKTTRLENLSFSSSEHDIYNPHFDSDEVSDDTFIGSTLTQAHALDLLSRSSLPQISDITLSQCAVEPEISSEDTEENVKTNKVYKSQIIDKVTDTIGPRVSMIMSSPAEDMKDKYSRTFCSPQKGNKPENKRPQKTPNPGRDKKPERKRQEPQKAGIRSSAHYESVIARNKAGIPIPILITSVVEHADPKTLHKFLKPSATKQDKPAFKTNYSQKRLGSPDTKKQSGSNKYLRTEVTSPTKRSHLERPGTIHHRPVVSEHLKKH